MSPIRENRGEDGGIINSPILMMSEDEGENIA
jgi:hypothetical protein